MLRKIESQAKNGFLIKKRVLGVKDLGASLMLDNNFYYEDKEILQFSS